MGSTITASCRVVAARDDARVYYAAYEETYESNVSPRRPRWSCVSFGRAQDVLADILRAASACEGGMLRGPRGRLTPEAYISRWIRAFARPLAPLDLRAEFSLAPISSEQAAAVRNLLCLYDEDALAAAGVRIADGLCAISIPLAALPGLVADLFALSGLPPYRGLSSWICERPDNPGAPECAFQPPKHPAPAPCDVSDLRRAGPDRIAVLGPHARGGLKSDWQVVADFVTDLADDPLAGAATYAKRLAALRAALANLPEIGPHNASLVLPALTNAADATIISQMAFIQNHGGTRIVPATAQVLYDAFYLPPEAYHLEAPP